MTTIDLTDFHQGEFQVFQNRFDVFRSLAPESDSQKENLFLVGTYYFQNQCSAFIHRICSAAEALHKKLKSYAGTQCPIELLDKRALIYQHLLSLTRFFDAIVKDCQEPRGVPQKTIDEGVNVLKNFKQYMTEFDVNLKFMDATINTLISLCDNPDISRQGNLLQIGAYWSAKSAASLQIYELGRQNGIMDHFTVDHHYDSAFLTPGQNSEDYNAWYAYKELNNSACRFPEIFLGAMPASIRDVLDSAWQNVKNIDSDLLLITELSQFKAKQAKKTPPYRPNQLLIIDNFLAAKKKACTDKILELSSRLLVIFSGDFQKAFNALNSQRMDQFDRGGNLSKCMKFLEASLPAIENLTDSYEDIKEFWMGPDFQSFLQAQRDLLDELDQIPLFVHHLVSNPLKKVDAKILQESFEAFINKEKNNARLLSLMQIPSYRGDLAEWRKKLFTVKEMLNALPSLMNALGYSFEMFWHQYESRFFVKARIALERQKMQARPQLRQQPVEEMISDSDEDVESLEDLELAESSTSIEIEPPSPQNAALLAIQELRKSLRISAVQPSRFTDACLKNAASLIDDLCSELADNAWLKGPDQLREHLNSALVTTDLISEQLISAALMQATKPTIWAEAFNSLRHSQKEMLQSLAESAHTPLDTDLDAFNDLEKLWERLYGRNGRPSKGNAHDCLLNLEKGEIDPLSVYRLIASQLQHLLQFANSQFNSPLVSPEIFISFPSLLQSSLTQHAQEIETTQAIQEAEKAALKITHLLSKLEAAIQSEKSLPLKHALQNAQRHLKLAHSRVRRSSYSSDIRNFVKKTHSYSIMLVWHLLLGVAHRKKSIDLNSVDYKDIPKSLWHWVHLCWEDKYLTEEQRQFLDIAESARNLDRYRHKLKFYNPEDQFVKDAASIHQAKNQSDTVRSHMKVEEEGWEVSRGSAVKAKRMGRLDSAVSNAFDLLNSSLSLAEQALKDLTAKLHPR